MIGRLVVRLFGLGQVLEDLERALAELDAYVDELGERIAG